ncbi:unnamed protein product [Prunus armeniaca]
MKKKTTVCSTCKAHFLTDVDYANHLPSNSKKCGGHNSAFVVGGLGSAGRHFGRSIYSEPTPAILLARVGGCSPPNLQPRRCLGKPGSNGASFLKMGGTRVEVTWLKGDGRKEEHLMDPNIEGSCRSNSVASADSLTSALAQAKAEECGRQRNRAGKYVLTLRFRPYPYVIVFDVWKAVERMSSRSDLSNLQETPSSRSAFRDDREDEGVVEQMFEAADQMGEDMPVGLGERGRGCGRGELRWVRGRRDEHG